MPLPVPNLDDRRFDDLVSEAEQRIARHLPELTQLVPGDPLHAFVDLFAWLTETILYRVNLVPERQRRVMLNLLRLPMRPAQAAKGLVCLDTGSRTVRLPSLVPEGSQLTAGQQTFSTIGEVQPTPLELNVVIKEAVDDETLAEMGFKREDLREQHKESVQEEVAAFRPRVFAPGKELLSLKNSLEQDKAYFLGFSVPRPLAKELDEVRNSVAGITLNIALAPADEMQGEEVSELRPRELKWEFMTAEEETGELLLLPLEPLDDSSGGGRRMGIVRLRLPRNTGLYKPLVAADPMDAGVGRMPPELPAQVTADRVLFWLRLSSSEVPDLPLGYMGVNGVEVVGQGLRRDSMVGIGTGTPDQVVKLPDEDIDPESIELDVEAEDGWMRWQPVDYLTGRRADERVYRLDGAAGVIYFGDGLSGMRPSEGRRIRIAAYRYGGGAAGNLPPGSIKAFGGGGARLKVRHEWPCRGGRDGESVADAQRRIPEYLNHRDRAVTNSDFQTLCLSNPVNAVARAEVVEGFLPGASIRAARSDVPGVVSVFVLPPGEPELLRTPKPNEGLLKDVFAYLLERVLLGTELYVLSPEFVPLAIGVRVQVQDVQTEQQTLRAVREALVSYLWPVDPGGSEGKGWPMGGSVRRNELMTQVARVEGIRVVNGLTLFTRNQQGWVALPEPQSLDLQRYQLPELLGVSVATGTGAPELPGGLAPVSGAPGGPGAAAPGGAEGETGRPPTPVPVIPDVC